MYSVLLSDGMTTSFTCATRLQSINRGDPHPLLPFDRGWPPPKLITECGYPHLLYSVWRMVGHLLSLKKKEWLPHPLLPFERGFQVLYCRVL